MAKVFLDTNILIYSEDQADPQKQRIAIQVIAEHAQSRSGVISTQVLQEFYSAATRKLGIEALVAKQHLQGFHIFDTVSISP
jgi:predicted nucleic acid-binding protein